MGKKYWKSLGILSVQKSGNHTIITARKRMRRLCFYRCLSVHGGGGGGVRGSGWCAWWGMRGRGACMAGCVHGMGACVAGGMHGMHVPPCVDTMRYGQ